MYIEKCYQPCLFNVFIQFFLKLHYDNVKVVLWVSEDAECISDVYETKQLINLAPLYSQNQPAFFASKVIRL